MKSTLPTLLGAGLFDSRKIFPDIVKTCERNVTCFELELFFEDGGCTVINGQRIPIKEGTLLLARPSDKRYSFLPFRCRFLHFDDIAPELNARLKTLPHLIRTDDFQKISNDFVRIIKHYCSADGVDNLAASAELMLLLRDICAPVTEENSIAPKAEKFIYSNFKEDLSVEKIAHHCNVSPSYLHKVYSKTFGIGPAKALLNRRIYKARELLVNTTLPLSEIAFLCGFHSQSYFSDCFKKTTGISPGEFRRKSAYTQG